jgi:hypothetical protein
MDPSYFEQVFSELYGDNDRTISSNSSSTTGITGNQSTPV